MVLDEPEVLPSVLVLVSVLLSLVPYDSPCVLLLLTVSLLDIPVPSVYVLGTILLIADCPIAKPAAATILAPPVKGTVARLATPRATVPKDLAMVPNLSVFETE